MKVTFPITDSRGDLLPGLFLSIISAALALPSLWNAWSHDLYAAGGFIAFLVWLSSLGITSYQLRHLASDRNAFWLVLSALLCMAGSMTSLRVCHHLALACALCGLVVPTKYGWFAATAALSWLPASGWPISRFFSGGMVGWERPTVSATAVIVLLICLHKNPTQPT